MRGAGGLVLWNSWPALERMTTRSVWSVMLAGAVMAGAGLRAQDKPKEAPPSKPTAGEAAKDGAKKEEAKDSKDEKKSVTEHAIPWGRVTAAPRSRRMRRISMACARMPGAWASSSGST